MGPSFVGLTHAMGALQIVLESSRHLDDLFEVTFVEDDLAFCITLALAFCEGDCSIES